MLVTIDGPSGTGKSTTAKLLAKKLEFSFFDTGALYRSLAWWMIEEGIDREAIIEKIVEFPFRIEEDGEIKKYFVGETDVSEEIRKKEITASASRIAAIKEVREALLPIQRKYAEEHDSVFEGRDLGTVVFPQAEVKIFLTAREDIRAKRRQKEIIDKDPASGVSWEEILRAQKDRDAQDMNRDIAPLKCPEGAFVLDTSDLSMEQVVQLLLQYIQMRC